MNKENIKILWEIYNDLKDQQTREAAQDYPLYEVEPTIKKLMVVLEREMIDEDGK